MNERKQPRGIQSIETGYRVLSAVQQGPGAVPLKEIARRAQLTTSAAHNYIVSLVRTGLAASAGQGAYRLGHSALGLGLAAFRQIDASDLLRSEAAALREETGLTVTCCVWSETGPVMIYKLQGIKQGPLELRYGVYPIIGSAAGQVYMTYLPPNLTAAAFKRAVTEARLTERDGEKWLKRIAKQVLADGYAVQQRSVMEGYTALAAPIWDASGELQFTISVVGLIGDVDLSPNGRHVSPLLRSTRRVSTQLGAQLA